jgi:hypothetical protein
MKRPQIVNPLDGFQPRTESESNGFWRDAGLPDDPQQTFHFVGLEDIRVLDPPVAAPEHGRAKVKANLPGKSGKMKEAHISDLPCGGRPVLTEMDQEVEPLAAQPPYQPNNAQLPMANPVCDNLGYRRACRHKFSPRSFLIGQKRDVGAGERICYGIDRRQSTNHVPNLSGPPD